MVTGKGQKKRPERPRPKWQGQGRRQSGLHGSGPMGSGVLWCIQMRMSSSIISSMRLSSFLAMQTECRLHFRSLYAAQSAWC